MKAMRSMKTNFDIVVVGGGLVGFCFALDLALRNHKLSIAILERKPYTGIDSGITNQLNNVDGQVLDNKIYAISPANIEYLKSLGIGVDAVESDKFGVIKYMDIKGDMAGNILFDKQTAQKLYLAKTIEYSLLQQLLYKRLSDMSNVTFVYDELKEIKYDSDYALLLGANATYAANLVVGSDGANSWVRQQAQIEVSQVDYGVHGVVANFSCEYPHNNVAYQWFNRGDVLAYLPLADSKQISIVWSTKNYQNLLDSASEELALAVAKAGNNKLGKLKVITAAVSFPLRLYTLEKIYARKILLIGDAAHTIHPLAGQGVNLGFGDARLLAKLLSGCDSYQLGDTALLARFNALRLPPVRQMQLGCHWLYRLFAADNLLLKWMRNMGLNLVNELPIFKKYLIKTAVAY